MKNRMLSLMLTCAMAVGLLAGCGGDTTTDSEASTSKEDTAQATEQDTSVGGEEKELTTIKILAPAKFGELSVEGWEEAKVAQPFLEKLEELGIRLEVEYVDNASLENVVRTRMASGTDLPDLVSYWNQDDVLEWGKAGLVYPVNELVDQYDEDGSIFTYYNDNLPNAIRQVTATDGNIYWFSYLYGQQYKIDGVTNEKYLAVNTQNVSIRADWVEAVGEELKDVYTPEELIALVKKIQDADANGNGAIDEVVYAPIDSFDTFGKAFGLNSGLLASYFYEENEVFSNFYHENFAEYIKFMQELYNNGLIDPSTLSMDLSEVIAQDRAILVSSNTTAGYEDYLANPDTTKEIYMPILVEADGDLTNGFTARYDNPYGNAYNAFFIPKTSEKAEAVVRLMDYVYSHEYAVWNWLGIEGEAFEITEEGNYKRLPGYNEGEEKKYIYARGLGNVIPTVVTIGEVITRYTDNTPQYRKSKVDWNLHFIFDYFEPYCNHHEFCSPIYAAATDEETTALGEITNVLQTYAEELLADLIMGNKSLDDMPEYLKEMEKLGLQEYIDIKQAQCDRFWE